MGLTSVTIVGGKLVECESHSFLHGAKAFVWAMLGVVRTDGAQHIVHDPSVAVVL